MTIISKLKSSLSSFRIIILGFAGVILLGAFLLMLPISSREGVVTSFDKTLFTATSAVCVTGLVVEDTATYWSYFGQALILIMIQIGGLGVITVASLLTIMTGKKIGLMQRQTMQNSLAVPQVGGIVKLTKYIFYGSLIIELLGGFLLLPVFCRNYGWEGIWMSFFHSVSAFCNAGFDLMGGKSGHFSSLTMFSEDIYLNVIISLLIIIGGIGFLTWKDITTHGIHFKQYRMQSKVILVTTLVLLLVPILMFYFIEFTAEPVPARICKSVFQAVSPRTAGFNTVDFNKMTDAGRTVIMLLMLVGGSPGSTAGGMKTTTIAVLFANAIAVFRRKKNASFFGRRMEDSVVKDAATILYMYVFLATGAAIVISLVERLPMMTCMFETFSAIATVGLTLGVTPQLGLLSRVLLIALMFFGRVGGLTIIFAAISGKDVTASKYPAENIMVG